MGVLDTEDRFSVVLGVLSTDRDAGVRLAAIEALYPAPHQPLERQAGRAGRIPSNVRDQLVRMISNESDPDMRAKILDYFSHCYGSSRELTVDPPQDVIVAVQRVAAADACDVLRDKAQWVLLRRFGIADK
jgi:hypothetical protein